MVTAIDDARSFIESLDLDDFQASKEKQYAVIRALEIIGEAAAQIPVEVRTAYLNVPWREIVGMRNVVIHHYFGVDETVIWRTVQEDLPLSIEEVYKAHPKRYVQMTGGLTPTRLSAIVHSCSASCLTP
jgi:uncharacterized protein with HEPN domain